MTDPIITKKYTLQEIDEMRACFKRMITCRNSTWHGNEADEKAERNLRTAMMAGIEPSEVYEEAQRLIRQGR